MNEEFLIQYLKEYNDVKEDISYLSTENQIRALMNITLPVSLSEKYYQKQDEYLLERRNHKEIQDVCSFSYQNQISLYQGDITLLKADAIVNACNEKMLGCFVPLHGCIDNCIHSYAGLEVRRDMMKMMEKQGHDEPNGQIKVTKGYCLPSLYIFHTVGPQVQSFVTKENEQDLRNCYLSCLRKADDMKLKTLVFCSLSTGVYGYPIAKASKVAIETVKDYLKETGSSLLVTFDVFSKGDKETYEKGLR